MPRHCSVAVSLSKPPSGLRSTVKIRRDLRDQKRKLLGYVRADKEFLHDVGTAIGQRKDNIDDFARAAEAGGPDVYGSQRKIARMSLGDCSVDCGISACQVVQRSVLVSSTGIVRHLQYPHEEFLRRRSK